MSVIFYALPALALLAALVLGRYPGERLILDAVGRRRRRPHRAAGSEPDRTSLDRQPASRGGDLLARALAGRAPPRTPATQCPSVI